MLPNKLRPFFCISPLLQNGQNSFSLGFTKLSPDSLKNCVPRSIPQKCVLHLLDGRHRSAFCWSWQRTAPHSVDICCTDICANIFTISPIPYVPPIRVFAVSSTSQFSFLNFFKAAFPRSTSFGNLFCPSTSSHNSFTYFFLPLMKDRPLFHRALRR